MDNPNIPFLDLVIAHSELEEELVGVFRQVLRTASFVGGRMVEEFELAFAQSCETACCVGVGSGTDALRFALTAAGVKPNDIVVTVPNTFIATAEAISQAGARPDFVDVDEATYNMDPEKLREYLELKCNWDERTGKTVHRETKRPVTAVVPVHLYGQTADMDAILDLAERHGLIVVEDACQAHGAEYFSERTHRWMKAGSMGRAAAFSFYPGKNLGACGEAGAVTTDDKDLAQTVRMLRDHGQARKYYHAMEGYNGRLDAIQAGILRIKLNDLPERNERRRQHAATYNELFAAAQGAVATPCQPPWARGVYHLYVVRTENRDQLSLHLSKARIGAGIHYPIPLHLQEAYRCLGYRPGDFPVSEEVASEILSLPMYPELRLEQQQRVVEEIVRFLSALSERLPVLSGAAVPAV